METHSLHAPKTDGGLLAVPPLSQAGVRLDENVERLAGWDHDFQGRRAIGLRALVRKQVIDRSRAFHARSGLGFPDPLPGGPFIVTGHQPELFHPGVWVKNFAVASIARERRGIGLNLIVDNDLPKGTSIRIPHAGEAGLRTISIDFDDWAGETPFEDLLVRDEGRFSTFSDRALDVLGGQVVDPLIREYWPLALKARAATDRVGMRLAIARRALESSWGVNNLEVPLSDVCESEGFLWFASHLLAHLPRFQDVHNKALDDYRRLYGIRSRHHPVPALTSEGGWREAPFWAWRASEPRRRPLLARQKAKTMEIKIWGEPSPLLEFPLSPDADACCAVEALMTLPFKGVRLRSRALTTTMFARFLVGDLFLHGIGGAKYDELGDEVARRFFGVEPPAYSTLSMTLWLGLPLDTASPDQLHAVDRRLRDLSFNPDRHLADLASPEARAWIDSKRRAIEAPVETSRQRKARFREIVRCNEALQPFVEPARSRLAADRSRLAAGLRHNAIARSREFAFVLHSRERLRQAMEQAAPGAIKS